MIDLKPAADTFTPSGVEPSQPSRASTIEQATWDLWRYVRENAGSLDSERCTAEIHRLVDVATADLQAALAESEVKRQKVNMVVATLRKELGRRGWKRGE